MEKVIDVLIPTKTGYNIKRLVKTIIKSKNLIIVFQTVFFSIPRASKEPRVKVHALHDYCKEKGKGVTPAELSNTEIERLLV